MVVLWVGAGSSRLPMSLALWLFTTSYHSTVSADTRLDGDLMFGGLFPIHGDGSSEGKQCSEKMRLDSGYQRSEAMLYAIQQINADDSLLPGISLGVHILDTCSQDTHALEQAMEFTKPIIAAKSATRYVCPNTNTTPLQKRHRPLAMVIGAASSQVSVMVHKVLRIFQIPQISYSSTSIELSDRSRFHYFARVVPSDALQAQAIVDIVQQLGWTFVYAVHDEGQYGEKGTEAFKKRAKNAGICIAQELKIRRNFQQRDFTKLVEELQRDAQMQNRSNVSGVIMWSDEDNVKQLLAAVHEVRTNMSLEDSVKKWKTLMFVATDNWGNKRSPIEHHPDAARGSITCMPFSSHIEGFKNYFVRLTSKTTNNSWFNEFWNASGLGKHCRQTDTACRESLYVQENFVPFVIDAVYAGAHALHSYLVDVCGSENWRGCVRTSGFEIDGPVLYSKIRNISFDGNSEVTVNLDDKGDRLGTYAIFQLKKIGGETRYDEIGNWQLGFKKPLNITRISEEFANHELPPSGCGELCEAGEARISQGDCCWICHPCQLNMIVRKDGGGCTKCNGTFMPNQNRTLCIPIPITHMTWLSLWSIGPLFLSFVGIVATAGIAAVFHKFGETPVIKASGRELCYFMLSGIFMSYSITFFLLSKPSIFVCTVLRVGLGVSLCMCYAAILTKTNRLARIFNGDLRSAMAPKYITPRFQIMVCSAICSVQIVAALIWFIFEPPLPFVSYPEDFVAVQLCHETTYTLIIPLAYNGFLVVMCTIYAFKTRSIPESFNETKHIGFTMYSSCIVWAAFVPIYFGTKNFRIQITTLCMCISICATVKLCCFFAPKVYVCIFEPHKNVRQPTLTSWRSAQMQFFNQQMQMMQMRGIATQCTHGVIPPPVGSTTAEISLEAPSAEFLAVYPATDARFDRAIAKSVRLPKTENNHHNSDVRKRSMPQTSTSFRKERQRLRDKKLSLPVPGVKLPANMTVSVPPHTGSGDVAIFRRIYRKVRSTQSAGDIRRTTSLNPPPDAVLAVIEDDEGTMV